MKSKCPHCDVLLNIPDDISGKPVKCKCGKVFKVASENRGASKEIQMASMSSAPSNEPIVLRASGGSIRTLLSRTNLTNPESSLQREFITVIDPTMPVGLGGCTGVITTYDKPWDSDFGDYYYKASFIAKALEPITAFQVRFLLFDVWGEHMKTLSSTHVLDIGSGQERTFSSTWREYDENDICHYYASIAYLSTARTVTGKVIYAEYDLVMEEAQKFAKGFTHDNLVPTAIKKP